MRGAPAFEIDLAQGVAWPAAIVGLCAAAAGCVAAWLWLHEDASPITWAAAACAAAAVLAAATLLSSPHRRLRFDGALWWLEGAAGVPSRSGQPRVAIDLGSFLVLRFRPDGARVAHWLAVGRGHHRDAWHLLRCAVYSPRSGQAPPAADAPVH